MPRDILGNKVGWNSSCWCGSGKKYKHCHYAREHQRALSIFDAGANFRRLQSDLAYCSCDFDIANCSQNIVRAHSISKAAALSNISERDHVATVQFDERLFNSNRSVRHEDTHSFARVGTNRASITRSFCEYHDNTLFKALDKIEFQSPEQFAWQLFYRTICFELYLKRLATQVTDFVKEMDRGTGPEQQLAIQKTAHKDKMFHQYGLEDLEKTKRRLEEIYRSANFNQVGHLICRVEQPLPVAASGSFQPEFSPDGTFLQHVNVVPVIAGRLVVRWLDSICLAILPTELQTFFCLVFLNEHYLSRKFVEGYRSISHDKTNAFLGLAILHTENLFYRPSFAENFDSSLRQRILRLHGAGIGEPFRSQDIETAVQLPILSNAIPLTVISAR